MFLQVTPQHYFSGLVVSGEQVASGDDALV